MQLGPGRSPCRREATVTTLPKTVCLTWRTISAGEELLHYDAQCAATHRKQRLWPFAAPVKSTERSEGPCVPQVTHRGGQRPQGRALLLACSHTASHKGSVEREVREERPLWRGRRRGIDEMPDFAKTLGASRRSVLDDFGGFSMILADFLGILEDSG